MRHACQKIACTFWNTLNVCSVHQKQFGRLRADICTGYDEHYERLSTLDEELHVRDQRPVLMGCDIDIAF
jgi:hypothetical protein